MNDIVKALILDSEYLFQMTGEDHGPTFIATDEDVYFDIADLNTAAWQCHTCGRFEYHVFGFDCEECGWSADEDRVKRALVDRESRVEKQ
ncbi:MAG: hypothetical protein CL535_16655 [Ahrensia sp.]|nr:hypothetical protein [Ahrensia sp.]MBV48207.1 hypothetical protein [Roseobacter sp.]MBV48308.1 hypothetical protein [Roseobacter sp.]|tara:strand:+ start:162781 stop:163050 length:270 start_codon:yes stop_codon:yes gene_type:complete